MRPLLAPLLLLLTATLYGQTHTAPLKPDLGILFCWDHDSEATLAHDKVLLTAVGRVLSLDGVTKTIEILSQSCGKQMPNGQKIPDAACFGAPGGVMCRLEVIERILRAAAWITIRYNRSSTSSYEDFWKADPEYVGHAFQYADGATVDQEATSFRQSVGNSSASSKVFFEALVQFDLAALLGHETAHAHDDICPIATKSVGEETGLLKEIIADEQAGAIFLKHSPALPEVGGDRCGMRHIRALLGRQRQTSGTEAPAQAFLRRVASDMVAFQAVFGWRPFPDLPIGQYAFVSLPEYLYSPYRAILLSREIAAASPAPFICGSSAQLIVQSIQKTYKKYEGNGNVSDGILALFPKGVETSWNGAPWTQKSYTCAPNLE